MLLVPPLAAGVNLAQGRYWLAVAVVEIVLPVTPLMQM